MPYRYNPITKKMDYYQGGAGAPGVGDMLKASYDPDGNGIVNAAEALYDGSTSISIANLVSVLDPNIIHIRADGLGDYATITAALAAISDESSTNHYVLVLGPGTYTENITMRRFIHMLGVGAFGPVQSTVITSSSGDTITAPCFDCAIDGLAIRSTSSTSTDSAIHYVDDGNGAMVLGKSFINNFSLQSINGSYIIHLDTFPVDANVIAIRGGIDAYNGGTGIMADAGGLVLFTGGMNGNADIGAKMTNGGMLMLQGGASVNADLVAGQAVECDGGAFICLNGFTDAYDGIKLANGSMAFLVKVMNLGGFVGAPMDMDATSLALLGDIALNTIGGPGSGPWENWNVLGTTIRAWTGTWGKGTAGIGGNPDQRPTGVPQGYEFFALDMAPGGGAGVGAKLIWNGTGWVDSAGAIIP